MYCILNTFLSTKVLSSSFQSKRLIPGFKPGPSGMQGQLPNTIVSFINISYLAFIEDPAAIRIWAVRTGIGLKLHDFSHARVCIEDGLLQLALDC